MRRLVTLPAVVLVALATCGTAVAHQGNPNMESVVDSVTPHVRGISLQVLNRDDRFQITNRSGQPVTIYGYSKEPYARLLADGTVEVNRNSPAYYLDDDRYAAVKVPANATPTATPSWSEVDKTHTFQWHDHRMHYMARGVPPSVKDKSKRQKIFNYTIPIQVGARRGAIAGTLWWSPEPNGGPPAGAIVAFVVLVLVGGAAVVLRRRHGSEGDEDEGAGGGEARAPAEAW